MPSELILLPTNVQPLETYLSTHHKGEWLAGPKFTAANIMMSYTLGLLTFTSQSPAEVPAILTGDKYPVTAAYSLTGTVYRCGMQYRALQPCGDLHHARPASCGQGHLVPGLIMLSLRFAEPRHRQ